MKRLLLTAAFIAMIPIVSLAQGIDESAISRQANNPLASIKSVSLHNVYTPSIHGMEGSMNTAWIRYAQPIGKVLIRASLPINTINTGTMDKSGLGDLNIFGTYILTKNTSPNQVGIGPIFTFPTATSSLLGSGKWQIGAALAAYFAKNQTFQAGLLATWQHSFAGKAERNNVNIATIQPFFMWQLGKGLYLRSTAITALDFENHNFIVPLGLGIGKIVKVDKVVFNLFAEPQFTVWHYGENMPKTQIFIGINTQF